MNNKVIKLIYSSFMFIVAYMVVFFEKIIRLKQRPIWLIAEQKNMARDNGIVFYDYCTEKCHKSVDAYYVMDFKSPDYDLIKNKKNLIKYCSLKHFIFYIKAEVLIMCFPDSACPSQVLERFLRKIGFLKNKKVYLKHGIIKDNLSCVHSDTFYVDMISTASAREKEYIDANFGYNSYTTKLVGLTRYDNLKNNASRKQKIILVMPTWRKYIKHDFKNSDYCRNYQALLDGMADLFSDDKNIKIYFYLHNNFQKYSGYFSAKQNVKILKNSEYKVGDLLCNSNVLITDYSSVAFDFAYMDKPIVYFQFDGTLVRKSHYSKGYFDYNDDGFGPVCDKKNKVLSELKKIKNNNFSNSSKYTSRSDGFYAFRDRKNCKRTYDAILELLREGEIC